MSLDSQSTASKDIDDKPIYSPASIAGWTNTESPRAFELYRDQPALRAEIGEHLCAKHRGVVHRIAWQFSGRNEEFKEELAQEGFMGLLHAAELFEPERGLKFITFARHHVEARIRAYAVRHRKQVFIGRRQIEKGGKIRKATTHLQKELGRTPTEDELANHLKVSRGKLTKWRENLTSVVGVPLDGASEESNRTRVSLMKVLAEGNGLPGKELPEFEILLKKIEEEFKNCLESDFEEEIETVTNQGRTSNLETRSSRKKLKDASDWVDRFLTENQAESDITDRKKEYCDWRFQSEWSDLWEIFHQFLRAKSLGKSGNEFIKEFGLDLWQLNKAKKEVMNVLKRHHTFEDFFEKMCDSVGESSEQEEQNTDLIVEENSPNLPSALTDAYGHAPDPTRATECVG